MDSKRKNLLEETLHSQKEYYAEGITRDVPMRIAALKRLRESIRRRENEVEEALRKDLHKSAYESYLTEIGIVLHELNLNIRNLRRWSRPEKVGTPSFLWPSRSRIVREPYGHALVIAPWNYPFQLSIIPVISAVAAGNVVALKPSHKTSETARVIAKIIGESFDGRWVSCFVGETEISTVLLEQKFDYILFTGSPHVGKIVMEAASKNLTPVTLELGGKSPCIVDRTANLRVAARRIVFGKLINAGQTCIAPDYLLVHSDVKQELLSHMKHFITVFYGEDPAKSGDYPRIITQEAARRLAALMQGEEIYTGGTFDVQSGYVAPTILDNVTPESPVMQEEIFGPILPVLTVADMNEAVEYINAHPKPLALYYFGNAADGEKIIALTSSGGACINDTMLHVSNPRLPFGGVGNSGMGCYHGRYGFETFSHSRSVLTSKTWIDFGIKFPPFKKISLLKKFM